MTSKTPGFATRAIHHAYQSRDHHHSLVPPIYQTATFTFDSVEHGAALFAGEAKGHFYTRISNPTLALLEERVASLEQGAAAIAFGSGMGAVTSVLWTLVKPGDVVLADRTLYGCTFAFFRDGLQRFGVQLKQVDMQDLEAVQQGLKDGARVVYFETPANPNMRLVDIEAVSAMARKAGALTVVDNTYCSPYLQRPLTLGADVVLHSATKYLGGHGDITAGIVVAADAELAMQIRLVGLKDMTGAVLSPHDAHLMLRGLKTLHLRMERHCDNAQELAERLAAHPAIARVDYPGLSSFPQHDLARRQMKRFGGMMSFELKGGRAAGVALMNALELITLAVSLGDAETLTQHPASMTHSTYSPEERAAAGISDGLVRLSAGLEDVTDLWGDLQQALARVA